MKANTTDSAEIVPQAPGQVRKARRRARRGPAEMTAEALSKMTPDQLHDLGLWIGQTLPFAAEILLRGIDVGRTQELRELGDTRPAISD